MSEPAMFEALAEQWDRVNAELDAGDRALLQDLVERLANALPDSRPELRAEIRSLLFAKLEENDPVVVTGRRFSEPRAAEEVVLAAATTRIRLLLTHLKPWPAHRRILATACESASVLRRRGIDPDLPDLIRLDREDGTVAVPSFQFDAEGAPVELVLRVNRVLEAWEDPWGVADWWLSRNTWLNRPPVELLPESEDTLVMAAALALVEG
ncbi:hypothetical protein [Umezawaea sp. Da 62-37]|uniref:hypothetical protein n=1 Tax=Umezawaea sp. Da 62-37 TaxID=3075927 RepID=UPI0028F6CF13|nr:hypothetical protein [Umezawaea sp. Da 62-37]WNV85317.1 hypothetical protein RM788_45580 [Umezawaea sp. Da 62-37]